MIYTLFGHFGHKHIFRSNRSNFCQPTVTTIEILLLYPPTPPLKAHFQLHFTFYSASN